MWSDCAPALNIRDSGGKGSSEARRSTPGPPRPFLRSAERGRDGVAVERVTWISWPEGWSRMPEIWEGWAWNAEHRQKAFVNVLRLRNVNYRGKAREIAFYGIPRLDPMVELGLRPDPTPLDRVVAGLLRVSFSSFYAEAEYQRDKWSAPPSFPSQRLPFSSVRVVETAKADVSEAELAWEELRDALYRYEVPDGAQLNSFSREHWSGDVRIALATSSTPRLSGTGTREHRSRRAAYKGPL